MIGMQDAKSTGRINCTGTTSAPVPPSIGSELNESCQALTNLESLMNQIANRLGVSRGPECKNPTEIDSGSLFSAANSIACRLRDLNSLAEQITSIL